MKLIKKLARIAGLLIMIALASLGIGLTGAAPLSLHKRGEDNRSVSKIERVDDMDDRKARVTVEQDRAGL